MKEVESIKPWAHLYRLMVRFGLPLLLLILLMLQMLPAAVAADAGGNSFGIPAVKLFTDADGSQSYTVTIQILALMTAMSFLPAGLMMMTSFTRIVIVFSILRQAMGLHQSPSNQIIVGLALFLSIFVMGPVIDEVNRVALQPYLSEEIGSLDAAKAAAEPFRTFMLAQTREDDLGLFVRLSRTKAASPEEVPMTVLIPSFVTSELKTAFQIGFFLFIPFLIIDLVVASVLMAMGMMMLSPLIVSLPFKIMLFVFVDGWAMIMGTLAASFGMI